jgi:septal ring factor EnvC (AmiA/AmiB activator)
MGYILVILMLVGAAFALACAVVALRAYLRLRRARAAFSQHLTGEVDDLTRRTAELEESLSELEARAEQLPVQIAELQQSLATLRVLTEALSTSLRQVQKVLSYSALKTLSATRLAEILQSRQASKNDPRTA